MSTSAPSLGISPPLSLSGPTEEETQESNALQKLIIELEPPCAEAELRLREQVLAKLNDIVKQWIVKISVQKVSCSCCKSFSFPLRGSRRPWQKKLEGTFSPSDLIGWVWTTPVRILVFMRFYFSVKFPCRYLVRRSSLRRSHTLFWRASGSVGKLS